MVFERAARELRTRGTIQVVVVRMRSPGSSSSATRYILGTSLDGIVVSSARVAERDSVEKPRRRSRMVIGEGPETEKGDSVFRRERTRREASASGSPQGRHD